MSDFVVIHRRSGPAAGTDQTTGPISPPMERETALNTLRRFASRGADLELYDLVSAESGRFVSWVL